MVPDAPDDVLHARRTVAAIFLAEMLRDIRDVAGIARAWRDAQRRKK